MPDASSDEAEAELDARVEQDAEPEHQERSAMAKFAALREKYGAEVRERDDGTLTRAGLVEGRLWAALDRAVYVLGARLVALEASDVPAYLGDASGDAEAVRNIAETLDRLGLLKPPPPPVEAPGPDVSEVWYAAKEIGLSSLSADRLVQCLRERCEGRA
jgi:hypothetical protein